MGEYEGGMTLRVLVLLMLGVVFALGQADVPAKEKQFKEALFALRTAIDEYTFDHHRPARSLNDLVREHYLRRIPIDPMTGSRSTWRIMREDPANAIQRDAPGIFDIRSTSNKRASDGSRYSEW
jgi:general secretion pathway protein G